LPARGGEGLVIGVTRGGKHGATIAALGVFPDKLKECQGLLRQATVQVAYAGKDPFGDLEVTFRDEPAHDQSLEQETIQGKFRSGDWMRVAADFDSVGISMSQVPALFDAPENENDNDRDGEDVAAKLREHIRAEPLIIFACATFISQTGRIPSRRANAAVLEGAEWIARADPGAIRDELTSLLVARDVHLALQWLYEVGVLQRILPELAATVDFSQEAGRKHKDVWEHTKQVVRQAVPRPDVRWAALLHDIGKVPTRTFTPDGGVHFHGHSEVGARMFDPIARRFAFDRPLKQKVRFLILHHLRANQYSDTWSDSAVRRFDREMGEHLTDLLDLSRADITSKRPGRRQELLRQIHDLSERIQRIRELDAKVPPLPTGLGTAIAERFAIPPSKRIGDLKHALEDACERGDLEERRENEYYLDWLSRSGLV
jgi:poly(A) polymerase